MCADISEDLIHYDVSLFDKYGFLLSKSNANGTPFTSEDMKLIRRRECKWNKMLMNWKSANKRMRKIIIRCRKGIPQTLRGKAWLYLSCANVTLENNPGRYSELVSQPGDRRWLDLIEKDVSRSFPTHELFCSDRYNGRKMLFNVLKAYSIYNPTIGYCQSLAPITSVLLMHMTEEMGFWVLVKICERHMPFYHCDDMVGLHKDFIILEELIKSNLPKCYRILAVNNVDPAFYCTEWFMCVFSRSLPWEIVLRIWDMFMIEGRRVLFRVALVLIRSCLSAVDLSDADPSTVMMSLKTLPDFVLEGDYIIRDSLNYKIGYLQLRTLNQRADRIHRRKVELKQTILDVNRKKRETMIECESSSTYSGNQNNHRNSVLTQSLLNMDDLVDIDADSISSMDESSSFCDCTLSHHDYPSIPRKSGTLEITSATTGTRRLVAVAD